MTSIKTKIPQNTDSDIDRYLKESSKSYKECSIKNNARRNSLLKKTRGIESEKRIASASLSREEKQLKEHLRLMNIEKAKHHILHHLRDPSPKKKTEEAPKIHEPLTIPLEPYPITFSPHGHPQFCHIDRHLEDEGHMYTARRGRRVSKEFEDLNLPSRSKTFLSVDEHLEPNSRRRVYSMSSVQNPRKLSPSSHKSSPQTSPDQRRKMISPRKKKGSNSSGSRESGLDSINSLEDLHWIGEPEAIHSIRRPRRTADELELESELHRMHLH